MSINLYWSPKVQNKNCIGKALRDIVQNEYNLPVTLNHNDLAYFKALLHAKIEGAEEVYDAISEYGEIILEEIG